MQNPRLATRYAKSLIDLAIEKDQLEPVHTDMKWLQSVLRSNRDFLNVLRSPVIQADMKKKIIGAVTAGRISVITSAFTNLLITKGRESNLPEVIDAFINQYNQKKEIHTVKLTTAIAVDERTRQDIIDQVKKTSDYKNIELEEIIDPDIIGGFILQVGDQLVDASISYDLKAIGRQFENNDFIYKVR